MMKRFLGIFIPILTCATLVGQDYVMFQTSILKLRDGKNASLMKGVKKHNAKYHNGENGPKAYLWYINTGPNSGNYSWAVGPTNFSNMDVSLPDDHVSDWEKNVSPYADETDIIYMIRDEELTYNPENETVGDNILMKRFHIKDGVGHMEAVTKAVGSITKVLRKNKAKIARRVYINKFPNKGQADLMLVYPFSSWSSFDQGWGLGLPEGFRADYEKMYGKGSFNKNVGKILEQHTYNRTNEVMTMVK
jgi:hypothetical protein|tara:strand:- start:275 stop:1018 length:744 start_codon:yes stop_codon:yes gene_type:complete